MRNKKILFILLGVMVLAVAGFFLLSADEPNYTIQGDTVVFENAYGKVEVFPHTASGLVHQVQYVNITWKQASQNIDFAFRLEPDGDRWNNKKIYVWANYSHINDTKIYGNVTKSRDCAGVVNTNYGILNSTHVWCNDSRSWDGIKFNDFWTQRYNSYVTNSSGARVFYYDIDVTGWANEFYFDWNDASAMFSKTNYNGNTYYVITNVGFNQNETKKIKLEFDIPPNTNGKWSLYAKRSSDTLAEALASGNYAIIDPWWNSTWSKKIRINVTNNNGTTLTNYQVPINLTYDSDMMADFSDLRFLDYNESTELDFYVEKIMPSQWAYVWVEIPTIFASSINYTFAYYKNSSVVPSKSNGTNTFLLFDDFDSLTAMSQRGWSVSIPAGVVNLSSTTYFGTSGKSVYVNGTGTDNTFLYKDIGVQRNIGRVRFKWMLGELAQRHLFMVGNDSGTTWATGNLFGASDTDVWAIWDGTAWSEFSGYSALKWYDIEMIWWENATHCSYVNQSLMGCKGDVTTTSEGTLKFNSQYYNVGPTMFIDDIFVAEYINPQPTYTLTTEEANTVADTTSPTVTLNSPANNTNTTLTTITFNSTVLDGVGISQVLLYGNFSGSWAINQTNSSGLNNTYYYFNISLPDGKYLWNIWANDTSGNSAFATSNFTLNVSNSSAPWIKVSSPTINNNYTTHNIWINATNSTTMDDWIVKYNGTNYTLSAINTQIYIEDGEFNLSLYSNTTTGAWVLNDSVYFRVDTTYPVFLASPSVYTYGRLDSDVYLPIQIMYNTSEVHRENNLSYNLTYQNGVSLTSNGSASPNGTISVNLTSFGSYTLNITGQDTFGNRISNIFNYTLSLVAGPGGSGSGFQVFESTTTTNTSNNISRDGLTGSFFGKNDLEITNDMIKKYAWLLIPVGLIVLVSVARDRQKRRR